MEVAKAFCHRQEEVPFTVAPAMEDFLVTGWENESDAGGEDELIRFIINKSVFDTESEICPATEVFAELGLDLNLTALIQENRETIGHRIANLNAACVGLTTARDEVAVDIVDGKDWADFRADDGIFKIHEIGHRRNGMFFPAHASIEAGGVDLAKEDGVPETRAVERRVRIRRNPMVAIEAMGAMAFMVKLTGG
jgi:hypothetical protein